LLLLITPAPPTTPVRRVTVQELGQVISGEQGSKDSRVAETLAGLELSERLGSTRLAQLQGELPGAKSKEALTLLADLSEYLDAPPAADAEGVPDMTTQRRIVSLAVEYVKTTIHKLPNFYATRDVRYYEDMPEIHVGDLVARRYQPLHSKSQTSDRVLYRDGREVVTSAKEARRKYNPNAEILVTRGVFGPILRIVLVDAANGSMNWSHWEQAPTGKRAVFQYTVSRQISHYQVQYCCFDSNGGAGQTFEKLSAYHGEISIDPSDGSIRRITVVADLELTDPMSASNISVDYGPVEIGGGTYICPLKSVSLWETRGGQRSLKQTRMSDARFSQYRRFGSESRLLIGDEQPTQ
jgi:hypothetical protein